MIKNVFQTGVVASLIAAVNLASAASTTELRGVRVLATSAGTQVVLDLSGATSEKLFTLEHPRRAVIDLGHTRMGRSARLPLGAGVVSGFRIGTQPGGTLRFVMQLTSSTPTHVAWVASRRGRQLIITLGDDAQPTPATATAATAAAASSAATVPDDSADPIPTSTATSTQRIVRAAHAPFDSGSRDVGVAVDAGHGGQDPGAIGHGGTREKDVTLAIARALAERINGEHGMRAVLTRNRDEFLVIAHMSPLSIVVYCTRPSSLSVLSLCS